MVRKYVNYGKILLCSAVTATCLLWILQKNSVAQSVSVVPHQVVPESSLLTPKLSIPELPKLENPDSYLPQELTSSISLVIRLKQRRVYLYQDDQEITSYPIAIGKAGWETPTGEYKILQMLRDPAWEHPWNGTVIPPGKDNPLGDRWIGFWTDGTNFIGFHGTPAEELVGQAVSHGCIRMKNDDVRALFDQVALGTPVIVEP